MLQIMALDFGLVRVGVAVANSMLKITHPVGNCSAKRREYLFQQLAELIHKWQPDKLVVGVPLPMAELRVGLVNDRQYCVINNHSECKHFTRIIKNIAKEQSVMLSITAERELSYKKSDNGTHGDRGLRNIHHVDGRAAAKIKLLNSLASFIDSLYSDFTIPIALVNEDYTSMQAKEDLHQQNIATTKHKKFIDAVAACAILERYFLLKAYL